MSGEPTLETIDMKMDELLAVLGRVREQMAQAYAIAHRCSREIENLRLASRPYGEL